MKTTWDVWDIEKGVVAKSFDTSDEADEWLANTGINGEVLESRNPWWAILNDFQSFLDTAPEWSDGDEIRDLAQLQVTRGFEMLRAAEEAAPNNGKFARIDLGLSDCLETDDPNQGETTAFFIHTDDGEWAQFTYEGLQRQDGSSAGLHLSTDDGFWRWNNLRWSDVTISFEPIKRYVVGPVLGPYALGHFDTLEEVAAFQGTLDQERLAKGDFYLDDMESGEA